ncbi:unnamed protein product [Coffea canephora]|uniref:CCHC-type domain-containing protein n=2 Tax=Coffea TaxID=13442 RepID=A0A068UK44_COFCA|nr:TIMELESS-interacting protein-like isoform X1 [Coffea arabica]CDP07993.1 unnamed protein product [Coffea canephora]
MDKGGSGGTAAAPTGCYKCGRPGHWSRDCPSNPPSSSSKNNNDENAIDKDLNRNPSGSAYSYSKKTFENNAQSNSASAAEKPKRLPRTRPKLTPDLLLSNDGIGHILRHFHRAFKYRGRGHEVSDLGNLLGLYAEWHSRLLPYFSFDQFVHKVEQIGTKNRVKKCIRELRERIADGVDPAELHEPQVQDNNPNHEQGTSNLDARDIEEENRFHEDTNMENAIEDNTCLEIPDNSTLQESNLNEIWEKAMEEPFKPSDDKIVEAGASHADNETPKMAPGETSSNSNGTMLSEEQRARMEANRLKALGKTGQEPSKPSDDKIVEAEASHGDKETPTMAPRKTSSSSNGTMLSEEQRTRMEANRLKALEKAAARARKL